MDKSTTEKQRCIYCCFFSYTHTETLGTYGSVSVNENQVASHTPASTDANRVFSLSNGELKVSIPAGAGGTIVSTAIFTRRATPRVITFEYNHNGLRTKKTVKEGGVTTTYEYTLPGKLITHMTKRVEDEDGVETNQEELHFSYDAQSEPAFVEYNGTKYRYVHNLQGDIVAIVDAAGNAVVEYKYDAWGAILSYIGTMKDTLGYTNPFRYRGYIYDEGTSMYWLRSRYYYPELHRFINADRHIFTGLCSTNLYAYCKNTPVMNVDPDGNIGFIGIVVSFAVASAVGYSREIVSDAADAFLTSKGWTLTNMLFQQGLWGEGQNVTDSSYGISTVKKLIAGDSQTYDMIKPYIEQTTPGTTASYVVMTDGKKGYQYRSHG